MQSTEIIRIVKEAVSDDILTFYDIQYSLIEKFEQEKDEDNKKQLKEIVDLFDRLQGIMIELRDARHERIIRGY